MVSNSHFTIHVFTAMGHVEKTPPTTKEIQECQPQMSGTTSPIASGGGNREEKKGDIFLFSHEFCKHLESLWLHGAEFVLPSSVVWDGNKPGLLFK